MPDTTPPTVDLSTLEAALREANIPTLLVVLAHITGDLSLLEGDELPSRGDVDGVYRMSEARQQAIRELALEVLGDVLSGKRPAGALPSAEVLQRMASVCVGEPVAAEYVPMMLEDMGFTDGAQRRVAWKDGDAPPLDDFRVLVVGAGLSGVSAGIHLGRAGIPYAIVEKNADVGGSWFENTYPACGVDTPNHFYSFSFEPNPDWGGFYSKRDELHRYIDGVADKYDVRPHVRFETEVVALRYLEDEAMWQATLRSADGRQWTETANVVLSAVGQVNRPRIPDFPGRERFDGPAFHSARWEHDHALDGKRVAVIGTGASAMQFAPAIADSVEQLTIFQRSPHWMRIEPDYHRGVGDGKRWLLSHVPHYQSWYRFKLFWSYGDGIWDSLHRDPDWREPHHSLNAENDRHRRIFVRQLTEALDGDEALMAKVIPDYPPFAKRMLIDNRWCEMLKRDDVELLTSGVQSITEHGVVDDDGVEHAADVIVYATGFHAHRFLWPIEVTGRSGATLAQTWRDDARAHLGMSAPDFPNLFFFYGPNTNLAHGGSMIFHIECQSRYITQCLMRMREGGHRAMEVRRDVHDAYNARVDAEHAQMVWTHPGVDTWYRNDGGRIVSVSPWRLVDYWQMTAAPDMAEFELT